jgi:VanZ family protein
LGNRGLFLYRHRKAILVILILMWIGAFTVTHIPGSYIPVPIAQLGDISLHGIGFLGLSSWFILTLAAFDVRPSIRILLVLVIMLNYGAVDEYTQQFFGRSTELKDWLTDATATVASLIVWETILFLAQRVIATKTPRHEI